jgi:hypothetical protein
MTYTAEQLRTMLAAATPGPWRTAKRDMNRVIDAAGTCRICSTFSSVMREEIDEANAALIAAAPGLAAQLIATMAMQARLVGALQKLDRAASEVGRYGAVTGSQWSRMTVAGLHARAVLAELEGD